MHRHGYQGRKLHRERDQRSALIKGLADSLVKYESIETTQVYLHADLALKERALQRTAPIEVPPGRYQPEDKLLAYLESL